jgi:hypothetical protein
MMDPTQLKAKKRAAQERLAEVEGVEGFGVGDGTIRVYLRSPEVRSRLPDDFEGVPLEFVVTGDIVAS